MRAVLLLMVSLFAFGSVDALALTDDLDTQVVLNTFKITNPKSSATVFILSRPSPDDEKKLQFIIVTALHVFKKMEGDEATLILRKTLGRSLDEWVQSPLKLKIRQDGKDLWIKHPTQDVAIMPFTPPPEIPLVGIPMHLLATDEKLKQYEIHPGDTMKHVGYPHPNQFDNEKTSLSFPVVRQGCIASYPLTPSAKYKTFMCDFNTFEGNSGGPIYLTDNNRFYGGQMQNTRVQLILGLLSLQHFINDKFENPYESGVFKHRLGLGVIVHASIIRETIDQLGKPATPPAVTPPKP